MSILDRLCSTTPNASWSRSRAASPTSPVYAIRSFRARDMVSPERTLRDELTARSISYALQSHSEQGELDAAVAVRRCVGTGMELRLAQSRANFHARTSDFVFLPERLALAPMVSAYPDKDRAFGRIVDWTISALIEAEALGITKDNVVEADKRKDMRADQLLGHDFATA